MDTVLTLDHVSKIYHNGRGARNITFSVERGQVVGLLGPNGSGKTTIMKSITGLSQPTEGTITVFGAPVTDREKALMQVGALIEQPALYENLTAQDHLRMAARYYPGVDQARMDKVLEIVGLTPYRKERCGKFSLGMKQRMGLALALLSEPELMILDEPTNGLDIEATVEMREVILRLAKEKGVTFLVASHLAAEIEKMCDKVLVLYEGELLSFDTKEEALRLHCLLHGLEEPYKEVFHLRVFGELPFGDIARVFGRTESWARVTFYRAKQKIIAGLEEEKHGG